MVIAARMCLSLLRVGGLALLPNGSRLSCGRLARRFRADERNVAVLAAIGLSFSSALVAMMVFPIWTETAESFRLGSWHLSYRAERLPWRHHGVPLFIGCVGVFLLISLVRFRRSLGRADAGVT